MTATSATSEAPAEREEHRRAAVYRLFDAEGTLLYIGSAYDPDRRCERHRSTQWWPEVAHRTDEWHANRSIAFTEETKAIWSEEPRYNVASTVEYVARRSAYGRARAMESRERSKAAYLRWTARRDATPSIFDLVASGSSWAAAVEEIRRCTSVYDSVLRDPASADCLHAARAERAIGVIADAVRGLAWPQRRRKIEVLRQATARELHAEGGNGDDIATVMALVHAQLCQLPSLLAEGADE